MMLWKFIILYFLASDVDAVHWNSSSVKIRNETTYRTAAYYVDWAIYARNFVPGDLPVESLTHVHYAFANISSDTGNVSLADPWADAEIPFPGDPPTDSGNNLYGCLKQLYLLKKQNRNLKVLLSIGGWTFSSNFAHPASTPTGRLNFATSVISLVKNFGFDGVDIDWEYPADDEQAKNMVLLLQATREALDDYEHSLSSPYHFELVVASPAGPAIYQKLYLAEMDQYVDFWNILAYDYAGSWSKFTSNQANLFNSAGNPASTPFDTQTAIEYYKSKGIMANKIVLGMPVYGRSFLHTDGLGLPFEGVGPGTWELGVYDFKNLPLSGAMEYYNQTTGSSYSYDAIKQELISYDNIAVATQKALFILWMGLGGAMWWESSADGSGSRSLIKNVVWTLGGPSALKSAPNQLNYPDSTYDNLRAGMPDSSVATSLSRRFFVRDVAYSSSTTITRTLTATTTICVTTAVHTPITSSSNSTLLVGTVTSISSETSTQTIHAPIPSSSNSTVIVATVTSSSSETLTPTVISMTTSSTNIILDASTSTSQAAVPVSMIGESGSDVSNYGSGCKSGGTCSTYNCVACSNGDCFCGVDASGNATCFQDQHCQATCSTNDDCNSGSACIVESCCGTGGYCISLAKDPSWCANAELRVKRDHGGGWEGIIPGTWSCKSFHQI